MFATDEGHDQVDGGEPDDEKDARDLHQPRVEGLEAQRAAVRVWDVGRHGREGEEDHEEFAEPAGVGDQDVADDASERLFLERRDVVRSGEDVERGRDGASEGDGEVHADEGRDPDGPGRRRMRQGHVVVRRNRGPARTDREHDPEEREHVPLQLPRRRHFGRPGVNVVLPAGPESEHNAVDDKTHNPGVSFPQVQELVTPDAQQGDDDGQNDDPHDERDVVVDRAERLRADDHGRDGVHELRHRVQDRKDGRATVRATTSVRPAPQATIKRETRGQPPAKRDAAIVRSPVLGPSVAIVAISVSG